MATEFRFFKAGSVNQLKIAVPADLEAVETLDTKLWLATSMPTAGIDFDAKTLEYIDSDNDGRIRVPELRAAVRFVREQMIDTTPLFAGTDKLALDNIKDAEIVKIAKTIFGDARELDLATLEKTFADFESLPFCGNGTLSKAAAGDDAQVAALIGDIAAACGNETISADDVKDFLKNAQAKIDWCNGINDDNRDKILPLAEKTVPAATAANAVRAKIDDYFARVHLANFDNASVAKLNPADSDIAAVAITGDLTGTETGAMPIAHIRCGEAVLNLDAGINPAWTAAVETLKNTVLEPLKLSTQTLTEKDWEKIKETFAPYFSYAATEPKALKASLAPERLAEIIAADPLTLFAPLFARDAEATPRRNTLKTLIRLSRYSRDLVALLHNFVSFADFYNKDPKTVFLNGKLYIDGRALSLCINVNDVGAHSALAGSASNAYLIYAKCVRKSDGKTQTICAMLGDGNGGVQVGTNGIFIDKNGYDYDATVVKVVEQSISLRQAFWSPYVKIGKFIEKQINNFAADREKKVDGELTATVSKAPAAAPAKTPFDIGKFMGVIAAAGLALGAIGAAFAAFASAIAEQPWWVLPIAFALLVLIISLPSVFLTAMKLRKRTISPILNANSWAINTDARLSIRLCKSYTELPVKPANSKNESSGKALKICGVIALIVLIVAGLALAFCPYCRSLAFGGNDECQNCETVTTENSVPAPTAKEAAVPAEATN
ncbi:MAG: hypothetical protein K6B46_00270 [Opitutales bacterium]|nr:hypothetical protein [Opitutales bacterium]